MVGRTAGCWQWSCTWRARFAVEHGTWDVLSCSGLGEKGSVTVVITVVGITVIKAGLRFLAIRLDTVFFR